MTTGVMERGAQRTACMAETGRATGASRTTETGRVTRPDRESLKVCPRCGAKTFADMDICYGCLYDFTTGEGEVSLEGIRHEADGQLWGAHRGTGVPLEGAEYGSGQDSTAPHGLDEPDSCQPNNAGEGEVSLEGTHGGVKPSSRFAPDNLPSFDDLGLQQLNATDSEGLSSDVVELLSHFAVGDLNPEIAPSPGSAPCAASDLDGEGPGHVNCCLGGGPCVRVIVQDVPVVVEVAGSNVTIRQFRPCACSHDVCGADPDERQACECCVTEEAGCSVMADGRVSAVLRSCGKDMPCPEPLSDSEQAQQASQASNEVES